MKIFKRILSLVIAVCVLASMAVIAASAVTKSEPREGTVTYPQRDEDANGNVYVVTDENGNPIMKEATMQYGTRPVISDVVNSDPDIQVGTKTYRFYMPDYWYNDRNDNYDGVSLDSCAAGIYWWGSTYNSDDYKGETAQGWPGFRILEQDPSDPHIFVCEVPEDAATIIFNNLVDGGEGGKYTSPNYMLNHQSVNIPTVYTSVEDDHYAFYENGLESMDGMIYVLNPQDTSVEEYSGATTTWGEWFYYYGDGKYGLKPTIEEAGDEYFANGDFPSSLQISDTGIYNYLNDDPTYTIFCNADPATLKVTSNDESIAKVGEVSACKGGGDMWKSQVTVTGVAEGDTSVVFEQTTVDAEGKESKAYRTCAVNNSYLKPQITASNKTIKIGQSTTIAKVKRAVSVSYSTSKSSVASVSSKGVVKGKAAGTAYITIKAKAGDKTETKKVKVTVKKLNNPMKVTAKPVTAKAKKTTTFSKTKYAKVTKAVGKVTYKKVSGDKKVTVSKSGKMTVKKGLKKGKTYTVKVKVTASGSSKYYAGSKTIKVKIKVK